MTPTTGVVATLGELIALRERVFRPPRPARLAGTAGNHLSRHHSRGMEFAEARPYQPGDDARSIDWRQTARRGRLYTKLFQEEHERPVWLLVDVGSSMRFGTRVAFKSVLAVRAAALLAWMATAAGDRVGGVVWNGGEPKTILARHGRDGALPLLRCMADASAAAPIDGRADLTMPLRALERALQPQATVVLLTDFVTMNDDAAHAIGVIGRRANLVLGHVYDEFEVNPPPGRYRFADGSRQITVNLHEAAARAAYAAPFAQRRQALTSIAQRAGAKLVTMATDCALESQLMRAFPEAAGGRAWK
jgi:uncharacterized protein (DUF58 family)